MVGDASRGAVVLEQAGDQLPGLRDRALTRLFDLTLLATALAVAVRVRLATVISLRIGRLRAAADAAVGNDGRIRLDMPESAARRRDRRAVARLRAPAGAPERAHPVSCAPWAASSSHELRTPLTIVRSSLDNLESEGVREDQRGYRHPRPRRAYAAAVHLERLGRRGPGRGEHQAGRAGEFRFARAASLRRRRLSRRLPAASRFELDVPPDPCFMRGAPDLIVQMLDKLIENAVDFCPAGGVDHGAPGAGRKQLRAQVRNDGPPIPQAMLGRLFESLFEQRQGRDDRPHFGLGSVHRAADRGISRRQGGRRQSARRRRRGLHRDAAADIAWHAAQFGLVQALVREQPALALEAAAVSRERAVGADHPMARHEIEMGLRPFASPTAREAFGIADALGKLAIAPGLAVGNFGQFRQTRC